jgi:hypothetical protein
MEAYLGRVLLDSETIHHINGDSTDDRIENLKLCATKGEHLQKEHPHPKRRPPTPKYTREYLLDALRALRAKVERVPQYRDLCRKNGMPSQTTYMHRFGNLSAALEEAAIRE